MVVVTLVDIQGRVRNIDHLERAMDDDIPQVTCQTQLDQFPIMMPDGVLVLHLVGDIDEIMIGCDIDPWSDG